MRLEYWYRSALALEQIKKNIYKRGQKNYEDCGKLQTDIEMANIQKME